jgi:hypothetical protein
MLVDQMRELPELTPLFPDDLAAVAVEGAGGRAPKSLFGGTCQNSCDFGMMRWE